MTREQVLAQLGAIRAICDALAGSLVQEDAPAEGPAPACAHPEGLRKDASTLRGPRQFFCQSCKAIVNEASGEIVG